MLLDQGHGFVAASRLPYDLVALLFEGLLEVEANDRLVLSNHHANGQRAAAFGGCTDDRIGASSLSLRASAALRCSLMAEQILSGGRSAVLGDQAVEELVL